MIQSKAKYTKLSFECCPTLWGVSELSVEHYGELVSQVSVEQATDSDLSTLWTVLSATYSKQKDTSNVIQNISA